MGKYWQWYRDRADSQETHQNGAHVAAAAFFAALHGQQLVQQTHQNSKSSPHCLLPSNSLFTISWLFLANLYQMPSQPIMMNSSSPASLTTSDMSGLQITISWSQERFFCCLKARSPKERDKLRAPLILPATMLPPAATMRLSSPSLLGLWSRESDTACLLRHSTARESPALAIMSTTQAVQPVPLPTELSLKLVAYSLLRMTIISSSPSLLSMISSILRKVYTRLFANLPSLQFLIDFNILQKMSSRKRANSGPASGKMYLCVHQTLQRVNYCLQGQVQILRHPPWSSSILTPSMATLHLTARKDKPEFLALYLEVGLFSDGCCQIGPHQNYYTALQRWTEWNIRVHSNQRFSGAQPASASKIFRAALNSFTLVIFFWVRWQTIVMASSVLPSMNSLQAATENSTSWITLRKCSIFWYPPQSCWQALILCSFFLPRSAVCSWQARRKRLPSMFLRISCRTSTKQMRWLKYWLYLLAIDSSRFASSHFFRMLWYIFCTLRLVLIGRTFSALQYLPRGPVSSPLCACSRGQYSSSSGVERKGIGGVGGSQKMAQGKHVGSHSGLRVLSIILEII